MLHCESGADRRDNPSSHVYCFTAKCYILGQWLPKTAAFDAVFEPPLHRVGHVIECHSSIIFVHGLTGDREETWKTRDATALWPQTLLPSKVPNAHVLTFGYDAHVANWQGIVSKNRIGNHAMNLLTSVATFREDNETAGLVHLKC